MILSEVDKVAYGEFIVSAPHVKFPLMSESLMRLPYTTKTYGRARLLTSFYIPYSLAHGCLLHSSNKSHKAVNISLF